MIEHLYDIIDMILLLHYLLNSGSIDPSESRNMLETIASLLDLNPEFSCNWIAHEHRHILGYKVTLSIAYP